MTEFEPVRVVGVVAAEVGEPRADGTRSTGLCRNARGALREIEENPGGAC